MRSVSFTEGIISNIDVKRILLGVACVRYSERRMWPVTKVCLAGIHRNVPCSGCVRNIRTVQFSKHYGGMFSG